MKSTPRSPAQAVRLTCKSADVPGLMAKYGEKYYSMPFTQLAAEATHPIGCSDSMTPAPWNCASPAPPSGKPWPAAG